MKLLLSPVLWMSLLVLTDLVVGSTNFLVRELGWIVDCWAVEMSQVEN
jgi:hypothetical protein